MAVTKSTIQTWLLDNLGKVLNIPPNHIDPTESFANYGLGSMAAVNLTGELETWLGVHLDPTLAWDYPTVETLSQYLVEVIDV